MHAKYFITVFFLIISGLLSAQTGDWEVVQEIPSVNLTDICFLDDGLHGFSAGSKSDASGEYLNVFYKTVDGGENWTASRINLTISKLIKGIFFITESKGWIVGADGLMLKTENGGESWSFQTSGTNRDIARVQFLDENNGWAAGGWSDGTQFLVLHTTNGGTTWQNLSFGSTAYSCLDIFFIDNQTGWICGHDNIIGAHIHKTTDGGQTWTQQTLPMPLANTGIASIGFATPLKGWATVTSIYLSPAGTVLQTEDGGETWTTTFSTNLDYNYLDVRDEMNVAIVGFKLLGGSSEKVFITHDGGANWNSANTPIKNYTEGISYVNDKIWISSNNSAILSTADDGATWDWENTAPWLTACAWQTADKGWCSAGSSAGTDHFTFYSEDAGASWNVAEDAPGGGNAFWLNEMFGWTLWIGNSAKIWRTIDGGITWTSHNVGGSSYMEGMFFITQDIGWVVGSNGAIRKTTNGGMTWTAQSLGVSEYVSDAYFIDENKGWAGGGYGGANGFIAHTENGGETWELQTMAQPDHVLDLFFLDGNHGWATVTGGRVHLTHDGGATWSVAGQINDDFADEILMVNQHRGWLIASNSGTNGLSYIYQTNDGGLSWSLDYQGDLPFSIISDLALSPDGSLWACGYHSAILKFSEIVGIAEPIAGNSVELSVNPNPASTFINLSFQMPASSSVEFQMLDMRGLVLQQWTGYDFIEGKQKITLKLDKSIKKGNYIISLRADSMVINRKVIIE